MAEEEKRDMAPNQEVTQQPQAQQQMDAAVDADGVIAEQPVC